MGNKNRFLINVGFLTHASVGAFREFEAASDGSEFDPAELKVKNIHVAVRVNRVQQGVLASAVIRAQSEQECVRCLKSFWSELHCEFDELFTFHFLCANEDDEIILPENGHMDLFPLIREYLLIEVPICPVCDMDCKGLCPVCGKNFNLESCSHSEADV